MIKVKINYKNNRISMLEIKGHAGFAEAGKDIVCAAVSSLLISSINNINSFDASFLDYYENDGYAKIIINKEVKEPKIILDNMIAMLYDLQKDYSKYIHIIKKEE